MVERPLHPLDHRRLQTGLCLFSLIVVDLNNYLVMHRQDRNRAGTLAPALPKEGEGELQSVGTAALDREVLRLPPHFVALPATHSGVPPEAAYPSSRGSEHACPYARAALPSRYSLTSG